MRSSSEIKAGLFLIAGLLVFILGIWLLGQEREVFSKKAEFYTNFKNVQGLSRGAPVRLSGITIGKVEEIGFSEKSDESSVHLTLSISDSYLPRLKTDSVISIQTQGLLGDKFLSIHPGNSNQPLLVGATLESRELKDVADTLQRASTIINRTAQISEEVNKVIEDFRENTLGHITTTSENLAAITTEIRNGSGLMHNLIYSKDEAAKISAAFDDLKEMAESLNKSAKALSQGSGTLGALLIDASLYDNLVEVTDQAKRNFLLKSAIRMSLKDQAKP